MIKFVKLGEACFVRRGTTITKKQTKKGNVPVIAGGRKATYFHNKHNREAGTITVSGSGASAGLVNYWSIPIFASDCSTVELKDNKQNIKFVYYFMQSKQEFIYKEMRSGAAQPHVYAKDIADLNFPLFSLNEQQRIVVKLDKIFAEIDKAIAVTKTTSKEAEVLFQKYLSKIFKGGDDWVDKSIDDITDKTKNVNPNKSPEAQFKYVDVSGVSNQEFVINETQLLFGKDAPSRAKKNIITNDIIFATVRPTLRRIAIVPKELNGQVESTGYVVLRVNKSNHFKFLFYFLLSDMFMKAMSSLQRGASYPAVTDMDVKLQKIKVPNYKEQIKIVEKLDILMLSIDTVKNVKNKKIKELGLLKQSILQQTLSEKLIKAA